MVLGGAVWNQPNWVNGVVSRSGVSVDVIERAKVGLLDSAGGSRSAPLVGDRIGGRNGCRSCAAKGAQR